MSSFFGHQRNYDQNSYFYKSLELIDFLIQFVTELSTINSEKNKLVIEETEKYSYMYLFPSAPLPLSLSFSPFLYISFPRQVEKKKPLNSPRHLLFLYPPTPSLRLSSSFPLSISPLCSCPPPLCLSSSQGLIDNSRVRCGAGILPHVLPLLRC